MASVNKVILVGNLGRDPEMKSMPSGDAVATLNIATTERWRDKATGTQREVTDWHRVVMFRRLAEVAGQYLHKGSQVYIEGRLRHRKWQDDKGQTRYTTEIEASEMKMLGSRPAQSESGGGNEYAGADQSRNMPTYDSPPPDPGFRDMQDDVPF